jgi:two-component system, cell cycle response regulator
VSEWDETTSVSAIAEPGDAITRDRAYLIVLAGSNVGEMYKISDGELVVGRGRTCDVRLVDDGVSRKHATIRHVEGTLWVEDLGSRNGTFANGQRIRRHPLSDGDKLQIGHATILKFTYHDHLDESFQKQMYDSALRDPLTRTYNKRYFNERLESEFRFAKRHGAPLSLLLLDLDHFKEVNDTHGHLAGDHVMSVVARRIQESVRNEDVFARYGGEEFAIISRAIPLAGAKIFGERLRRVIAERQIEFEGTAIPVTMSVGIAALPEAAADSALALLASADRALYWAKAKGRNCVALFDESAHPDEDTKPA